ncbi:hypothetical protein EZV62_014839 [Acer yangbiense]|uniref:DM2 domain-containing protein n=1 Tax=Acer yangbiense TaxID=1000413 RepID=A0A5C7HVD3_9ROSI|nr:hypothetical protein EZV62_014839 [Acer yangbiense]
MKYACKVIQPEVVVHTVRVQTESNNKAAAILWQTEMLEIDLLVIGQQRSRCSPSNSIFAGIMRIGGSPSLSPSPSNGTKGMDTIDEDVSLPSSSSPSCQPLLAADMPSCRTTEPSVAFLSSTAGYKIVKQLWAYIRKNNLQDPSNKRKIICSDEPRLVFETDYTDMFKMNKLLAKHIISLEPTKQSSTKKQKVVDEK